MAITFNPAIKYNSVCSFGNQTKVKDFGPIDKPLSGDEISIQRTKKAIYSSSVVVLGICWLYFQTKKNMKINARIKDEVQKYEKLKSRNV